MGVETASDEGKGIMLVGCGEGEYIHDDCALKCDNVQCGSKREIGLQPFARNLAEPPASIFVLAHSF